MKKILIANRGEIAVRIIRTARRMGISTVAIYSEADKNALHVKSADEAVCIGKSPSSESYLCQEKIIDNAKTLNVDAIHPGYGFLSENSSFAKKVSDAGMLFIGPDVHAIEVMGSKLAAKEAVLNFDIPLVPGTDKALTDVERAKNTAKDIGFPILIKASAGGGGKGMKLVKSEKEFEEGFKQAKSEALSAFGNDDVFIEKYIQSPRHIEFQVLYDRHGNGVHLFERECSIQRRHQKVIEETPSMKLDSELRNKMGQDALKVAKACNYVGAGTVEFIMDGDGKYYFLEMNTRLQVEHPVTEMTTGIDLVEQQIRIARNEQLSFGQDDLLQNGHAIELRIYAEDPANGFLPSIGKLTTYKLPVGEGVRLDNGFLEGDEIPIYYDPMIAKLTVHAETRDLCIARMKQAINNYQIQGIETTLSFGQFVLNHNEFVLGSYDTHFVDKYWDGTEKEDAVTDQEIVAAFIARKFWDTNLAKVKLRAE